MTWLPPSPVSRRRRLRITVTSPLEGAAGHQAAGRPVRVNRRPEPPAHLPGRAERRVLTIICYLLC